MTTEVARGRYHYTRSVDGEKQKKRQQRPITYDAVDSFNSNYFLINKSNNNKAHLYLLRQGILGSCNTFEPNAAGAETA